MIGAHRHRRSLPRPHLGNHRLLRGAASPAVEANAAGAEHYIRTKKYLLHERLPIKAQGTTFRPYAFVVEDTYETSTETTYSSTETAFVEQKGSSRHWDVLGQRDFYADSQYPRPYYNYYYPNQYRGYGGQRGRQQPQQQQRQKFRDRKRKRPSAAYYPRRRSTFRPATPRTNFKKGYVRDHSYQYTWPRPQQQQQQQQQTEKTPGKSGSDGGGDVHLHIENLMTKGTLKYIMDAIPWEDWLSGNRLDRVEEIKYITERLVEEGTVDEDFNKKDFDQHYKGGSDWDLQEKLKKGADATVRSVEINNSDAGFLRDGEYPNSTNNRRAANNRGRGGVVGGFRAPIGATAATTPSPSPPIRDLSRTHALSFGDCPVLIRTHFGGQAVGSEVRGTLGHYIECQKEKNLGANPFENVFDHTWRKHEAATFIPDRFPNKRQEVAQKLRKYRKFRERRRPF